MHPRGPISRVVIDFGVEELRKIEAITTELLQINLIIFEKLPILLLKNYVDCVLFAGLELKPVVTWNSNQRGHLKRKSLKSKTMSPMSRNQ